VPRSGLASSVGSFFRERYPRPRDRPRGDRIEMRFDDPVIGTAPQYLAEDDPEFPSNTPRASCSTPSALPTPIPVLARQLAPVRAALPAFMTL
jgi:hypothetical protein